MHIHGRIGEILCRHSNANHKNEPAKSIELQRHEQITCSGGKLSRAHRNWTTYEKAACEAVQTNDRLDYLLCGAQPVHIFRDHRKLLYVFVPSALRPDSSRHILSSGHRLAIYLSRFEIFIYLADGSKNIFADI